MRAALYGRKSDDRADSVEVQLTNARAFAQSKGWHVVQEFKDVDISGGEFLARDGFNALLRAAKSKPRPFDVVVFMNVDRFGRETYRTNISLLELAEAGCKIFTYADGQEIKLSSPIEKQMVSMRNYAAEDFRAQISDKTRESQAAMLRAGFAVSAATFGYELFQIEHEPHKRERPKSDLVPVVERVFTLATSHGDGRIAKMLNDEHTPAPGGKGWTKSIVKTLLVNRKYVGVVEFRKSRSAARGGSAYKREATPKDDWLTVKRPDLRIISDELWATVQRRRAQTRTHYMRSADGRLLSKPETGLASRHLLNVIARCGVCGGSLLYMSRGPRSKKSYYCSTVLNSGNCSNGRGIPMVGLDTLVREKLLALCRDEDQAQALIDDSAARYAEVHQAQNGAREQGERRASELAAIVARLTDAVEKGEPIGTRLRERSAELDALRAELAKPITVKVDKPAVVEGLRKAGLMVLADTPSARSAMRKLGVEKLVITPDEGGWTVEGLADLARITGVSIGSAGGPPSPPRSETARRSRAVPRGGVTRPGPRRAPQAPRARRRPGEAGPPLGGA